MEMDILDATSDNSQKPRMRHDFFEVSYTNQDDEPIDGTARLKAYKSAQALLSNKKTLLMYDEAEDIFETAEPDRHLILLLRIHRYRC